jgi:exodeoxyribonuclease-3
LESFKPTGYHCVFKGQKSYNGVALFSKSKPRNIKIGFDSEPKDGSRLIKAEIDDIQIVNTYVPQGRDTESEHFQYKLEWFERLKDFFNKNFDKKQPVLWLGDLNTARDERDVHDPKRLKGSVCFNDRLTEAFNNTAEWGFTDLFRHFYQQDGCYTFWDYRIRNALKANLGWRLDYIMVTKPLLNAAKDCCIDKAPRMKEKPSDHTPIIAEFNL